MTTSNTDLHWIVNYIWGVADDVLRDLYVRGNPAATRGGWAPGDAPPGGCGTPKPVELCR